MEFVIRIILFASFLLVVVVLISTDLYDVTQFNSTRFAQIEIDRPDRPCGWAVIVSRWFEKQDYPGATESQSDEFQMASGV